MATVTGYTAARMQEIEDGSITSASYDASGHLILNRHDGTQIDVGRTTAATTAQSGIVELATNAETQAGTDATRAITPAGLASMPGYRVQIVSGIAETATPSAWPYGVSMQSVASTDAWSLNSSSGTVVTNSIVTDRTDQTFYSSSGGTSSMKVWTRSYHSTSGGGGWTAWNQVMLMVNLDPTAYTQTTTRGNYPAGQSRLYYTTSNGTGWDFSGTAGEIITYAEDTNTFGRQVFTSHVGGSSTPFQWFRTANAAGGWTSWQKVITDPGSYLTWTPTWSTTSGLHLPSFGNATANFKAHKLGKNVHVTFDVTFGSTTNFGASATTTDNWTFSLPTAWPANTSAPGTYLGTGDMYKDSSNLGFTRIKLSGSTAISFGILTCFVAGALGGGIGGDVDSVTPWTWASGHAIRGSFDYETTA